MYEVPDKGTMKSEILHHLSVAKRGYDLKNDRVEVIQCGLLTSRKQLAKGQLLLRFHAVVAVVREQHALQPLALVVASVCIFRAVAMRSYMALSLFCLVFSKNFNIMSGLSIHQPLTVPQKIDSREGLFHCK